MLAATSSSECGDTGELGRPSLNIVTLLEPLLRRAVAAGDSGVVRRIRFCEGDVGDPARGVVECDL